MAFVSSEGSKGRSTLMFVCPCPYVSCSGIPDKQGRYRFHSSPEAVAACQKQYLIKQGYKQISRREYQNPETGSILVLSRRPARAKPGKGQRQMGKSAAPIKAF